MKIHQEHYVLSVIIAQKVQSYQLHAHLAHGIQQLEKCNHLIVSLAHQVRFALHMALAAQLKCRHVLQATIVQLEVQQALSTLKTISILSYAKQDTTALQDHLLIKHVHRDSTILKLDKPRACIALLDMNARLLI